MLIRITINGTRPLLMHNIRLANPLDPYTQQLKEYTTKRSKTDEDLAAIMHYEARGAAYETRDGLLGLPCDNLWRSLYDAATAYKQGANLKRALIPITDVVPIEVDGAKVTVDDHLNAGHIDYRAVQVSRSRTMRARPIVEPPWQATHEFELLSDIIDVRDLDPILARAGRVVGIGDWRPRFGTYEATVEEVPE